MWHNPRVPDPWSLRGQIFVWWVCVVNYFLCTYCKYCVEKEYWMINNALQCTSENLTYMDWKKNWRKGSSCYHYSPVCFCCNVIYCMSLTPPYGGWNLALLRVAFCYQRVVLSDCCYHRFGQGGYVSSVPIPIFMPYLHIRLWRECDLTDNDLTKGFYVLRNLSFLTVRK